MKKGENVEDNFLSQQNDELNLTPEIEDKLLQSDQEDKVDDKLQKSLSSRTRSKLEIDEIMNDAIRMLKEVLKDEIKDMDAEDIKLEKDSDENVNSDEPPTKFIRKTVLDEMKKRRVERGKRGFYKNLI